MVRKIVGRARKRWVSNGRRRAEQKGRGGERERKWPSPRGWMSQQGWLGQKL